MQIYSYFPLYTGSQIYKKEKQEKRQSNSLNLVNNNFTLPNYYGISFKALYIPTEIKKGIIRFETVFPDVLPTNRMSSDRFENFVNDNKEVLTTVIDEALNLGEWDTEAEKTKAEDLLRCKTGIRCKPNKKYEFGLYFKISATVDDIRKELGLFNETKKYTELNEKTGKLLEEQMKLLIERKKDFKTIFPDINFEEISDKSENEILAKTKRGKNKPEAEKIKKVITVKQLLEKISDKTVSGKTIEQLIDIFENARKPSRGKKYNRNEDAKKQIEILKYMFLPPDGIILSDNQIAKELGISLSEFKLLKNQGLYQIVAISQEKRKAIFSKSNYGKEPIITRKINEELYKRNITKTELLELMNCNINAKTLSEMILGKKHLSDEKLNAMAPILGTTFEEMKGWALATKYSNHKEGIKVLTYALKIKAKEQKGKKIQSTELKRLRDLNNIDIETLTQHLGYIKRRSTFKLLAGEIEISDNKIPQIAEIFNIPEAQIEGWKVADNYHSKSIETALNILIKEEAGKIQEDTGNPDRIEPESEQIVSPPEQSSMNTNIGTGRFNPFEKQDQWQQQEAY